MNKRIAFFMAAMFGVASAMASTTWYVDARHGSNGYSGLTAFAPKRTIQSAINAASSGDWIIVAGGTYTENLTLSKKLTLFSHEHAVSIIEGRHAGHCLLITENASGSVVDGFVFTHGAPTNGAPPTRLPVVRVGGDGAPEVLNPSVSLLLIMLIRHL